MIEIVQEPVILYSRNHRQFIVRIGSVVYIEPKGVEKFYCKVKLITKKHIVVENMQTGVGFLFGIDEIESFER